MRTAAPADVPLPHVPGRNSLTDIVLADRWALPGMPTTAIAELLDPQTFDARDAYRRNIENFVGTVKVPVGLAGPLRVNGTHAAGEYYVPLATTEAALVASYSRGAQAITAAGGCAVAVLSERVSRVPAFAFRTLADSTRFADWVWASFEILSAAAEGTTRHGRLLEVRPLVEGNHVYVTLEFGTGDAAGQNMVTIAADAICREIVERSPIRPRRWYIESNMSGDKKATLQSLAGGRGRKVSAEVVLSAPLLESLLHTTSAAMLEYWQTSVVGGVLSGSIGVHGHYANALAALFVACGQDVACVAEAAVGITRFEPDGTGGLYASVTLPNVIVGTVGGGTTLPSQRACLEILGLAGPGHASSLAEIAAGLALAGELSITAAIATGEFTQAHQRLARGGIDPEHAR